MLHPDLPACRPSEESENRRPRRMDDILGTHNGEHESSAAWSTITHEPLDSITRAAGHP